MATKVRRHRGLSSMAEERLVRELGWRWYLMLRRAQKAGYQFKICLGPDNVATIRPFNSVIGTRGKLNEGSMMRQVFIRWGKRKNYKAFEVLRFGKPKFNRTTKVPESWKRPRKDA